MLSTPAGVKNSYNRTSARELRKFVAPEVVFGVGARRLAGQYAANFGAERALLVTDPGVIAAGWTAQVEQALVEAGVASSLFSGVSPNPRAEEMMLGAEQYRLAGCDVIVAIGGGSVVDCAKGIGIVSSNRRHILEFEGVDNVTQPMPPVVCVPTTGGASADVSQFVIVTDLALRTKKAIISKSVVPDVALVDPETLTTMDRFLTACTGMDALVHAVEAFVSNAHSPLTDIHALQAIRLIYPNLAACVRDLADVELRTPVMLGSLEAGLAFSNASLGAVHAMAHSLGGYLDLPHGQCNSMLLRHVAAFNFESASERYEQVGRAMGLELGEMTSSQRQAAILAAIESLRTELGLTSTLATSGIHVSDVSALAEHALGDACLVTNPRRPNQRDLEVIYEEAL
jgi:alcohol dehydrogenase class IV